MRAVRSSSSRLSIPEQRLSAAASLKRTVGTTTSHSETRSEHGPRTEFDARAATHSKGGGAVASAATSQPPVGMRRNPSAPPARTGLRPAMWSHTSTEAPHAARQNMSACVTIFRNRQLRPLDRDGGLLQCGALHTTTLCMARVSRWAAMLFGRYSVCPHVPGAAPVCAAGADGPCCAPPRTDVWLSWRRRLAGIGAALLFWDRTIRQGVSVGLREPSRVSSELGVPSLTPHTGQIRR